MGRTNPTYRDYLRQLEADWQPFRRGLRRRYQADFDRLFDHARDHADAAGYANGTDPEFAVLLSILLAQEVELRRLRERLDECRGTEAGAGADADVDANANANANPTADDATDDDTAGRAPASDATDEAVPTQHGE